MRRTIRLIVKAVGAVLVAAIAVGLPTPAQAAPPAVAPPSQLVLDCAQPTGPLTTISGELTVEATAVPLPGQTVTITAPGVAPLPITTAADGSFSWVITTPAPGTYSVTAKFAGTETAAAAIQTCGFSVVQPKSDTSVTVALDSDSVSPGSAIGVSGVLTNAAGQPVDSAQVSIGCSADCLPATAVTGADGTYQTSIGLPDAAGYTSVTVNVSFAGDDVYNPSTGQATIAVVAASDTTAPTEAQPTDTQTSTATTQPTSSHDPAASPTPSAIALLDPAFAAGGTLMVGVFAGVAAAAVVILIAIGIISSQRHRLAKGERRGFGSDFGKHEH